MSRHRHKSRRKAALSSGDEDDNACHLVEQLLKGGLLKSIEKVVEQQAARVLSRHVNRRSNDEMTAGSSTSPPRDSGSELFPDIRCTTDSAREGSDDLNSFNPGDTNTNVLRWLEKIDQLGTTHGWSEYERTCLMQLKLKGAARRWYKQHDHYNLSWIEWKAFLIRAFPPQYDFAEMLEELLSRKKTPEESMAHYFHAKLALCERCEFDGEKAVSLIIHGLPVELGEKARQAYYKTPEELYSRFEIEECETKSSSSKRKSSGYATTSDVESSEKERGAYYKTPEELHSRSEIEECETKSSSSKRRSSDYAATSDVELNENARRTYYKTPEELYSRSEIEECETKSSSRKRRGSDYATTSDVELGEKARRTYYKTPEELYSRSEMEECETKSSSSKRRGSDYATTSDVELSENARRTYYKTPEELYSASEMDECETKSSSSKRRSSGVEFSKNARRAYYKTPEELYSRSEIEECETKSSSSKRRSSDNATTSKVKLSEKEGGAYYKSSEELYSRYEIEECDTKSSSSKRKSSDYANTSRAKMARTSVEVECSVKRDDSQEIRLKRCFNCQQLTTHISRNCPSPRVERCHRCKRFGHLSFDCREESRWRD